MPGISPIYNMIHKRAKYRGLVGEGGADLLLIGQGRAAPTLTRATTATVADYEEILRTVLAGDMRWEGGRYVRNLLVSSEDFTTIWDKNGNASLATANYGASPYGDLTADRIVDNPANTNDPWILQTITKSAVVRRYVFSVWIKRLAGTTIALRYYDNVSKWGPLRDDTPSLPIGQWVRLSFTFSSSATSTQIQVGIGGNCTADRDFLIWGAQLEDISGSVNGLPSEYVPTTSASVGKWFFTHPITGAPLSGTKLLMEGAGTNLILRSEDFASWNLAAGTQTQNCGGTYGWYPSADRIQCSGGGAGWNQISISVTTGIPYTTSVHIKPISNTNGIEIGYQKSGYTGGTVRFNPTTKAFSNISTMVTGYSYKEFSDGSFRVWVTMVPTDTVINQVCYNQDAAGDCLFYGYQLEQSAFPTSYIPTTTSAVTRNADTLSWSLTADLQSMFSIDKKWKTSFTDETGLTWGQPKNLCSFADGQSWLGHADMDFSGHAGRNRMVILRDSGGRLAWGYLGGAGPGETLGAEKVSNGNFEVWGSPTDLTGWTETISGSSTVNQEATDKVEGSYALRFTVVDGAGVEVVQSMVYTAKKLYKAAFSTKGNAKIFSCSTEASSGACWFPSLAYAGWTSVISYGRATANDDQLKLRRTIGGTYNSYFDGLSLREVTAPSGQCVYVYKDINRTTQGWNMEASFALNDSYTFDVVEDSSIAGTIVLEVTPAYTQANVGGDVGLLSHSNAAKNLLYHDATANLKGYDGTNNPEASKILVSGTTYLMAIRWGAAGLQVSIKDTTWTHGTATAFDGAFTLGTVLNLHYGNGLPAKYGKMKLWPRMLTDAELSRLA